MTFNILISCMHQADTSIIERSNVQSDVVVVNQCDHDSVQEFDFVNKKGETCHAKFICTTERGLSKSRNMAIRNAWGDVCQICDDDEWLADNGEEVILRAYAENPDAALIAFSLIRKYTVKTYPVGKRSLGFIQILKTSSQQVTFSRNLLGKNDIWFDEKMGSGTGNGGGEENKLMLDCRRKGLKLLYYPDAIATVLPGASNWFHGYDRVYMENFGWSTRRLLGPRVGFVYLLYWLLFKRNIYMSGGLSAYSFMKSISKGFFSER